MVIKQLARMPHAGAVLLVLASRVSQLTSKTSLFFVQFFLLVLLLLLLGVDGPVQVPLDLLDELLVFADDADPLGGDLVHLGEPGHVVEEDLVHVVIYDAVADAAAEV